MAHMMSCPRLAAAAPNGRGAEIGQQGAGQNSDGGRHQDVYRSFLADQLAQLSSDDGDEQHSQRTAFPAQGVGGAAHSGQGEQDKGRRFQGIADGDGHCRSSHSFCKIADLREQGNTELRANGGDDGADEQEAKSPAPWHS